MQTFEEIKEIVMKYISPDPSFAIFMVRDFAEVEQAGLKDLAWCLASSEGNAHKNDVIGFLELLEERMK